MRIIKKYLQSILDRSIYLIYRKSIVIKQNTYEWCSVPVMDSSPKQSQTHPSILYFKDTWANATHWLGTTPYPDEMVIYENPCIYYALSPNSPPTSFVPIKSNPILKWPGGNKFNSDIELFFWKNCLCALSREYDNETKAKKINIQLSNDGQSWSEPKCIIFTDDDQIELLSPSLINYNDKIRVYFLNGNAGIRKYGICTGIQIVEGTSFENPNFRMLRSGNFINKDDVKIEPWHCSLFEYKSRLYMVFCGRDLKKRTLRSPMETYLAVSSDYQNFYIYEKSIIRHIKTYRPTAYIKNGLLHLYFSVVGNILWDGVDRRIGLTTFDFEELLEELEK